MDEPAKCNVIYGTNSSNLGSSATSSSFSTAVSVSLSGLSASTTYYYNITSCWDAQSNNATLNYGTFNFTTTASTGGGGGGGGGGSYTTTSTFELGDLSGASMQFELSKGDMITFSHGTDVEHQVKVTDLGSTYADFEVLSEPITFRLYEGMSEEVDFDADGKDDLNVKLLDIIASKALVKLTSLATDRDQIVLLPPAKPTKREVSVEPVVEEAVLEEAVAPTTITEPTPVPIAEPETVDEVKFWQKWKTGWYWYAFVALVAIIAIVLTVLIIIEHRRKKGPGITESLHSFEERIKKL
jgi:hypothetical protein